MPDSKLQTAQKIDPKERELLVVEEDASTLDVLVTENSGDSEKAENQGKEMKDVVEKPAGEQAGEQSGKQPGKKSGKQAEKQSGKQSDKQVEKSTEKSTEASKDEKEPTEKKSGNGCLKAAIIGLVILLVICCISVVTAFLFAEKITKSFVGSTNIPREENIVVLTEDDLTKMEEEVANNEDLAALSLSDSAKNVLSEDQVEVSGDIITVNVTEEQLLYIIYKDMDSDIGVEALGLNIEPNSMVIEVDAKKTMEYLIDTEQVEKEGGFSPDIAEGVYFRLNLSTQEVETEGETTQSKIVVEDISTGNYFLDRLIPEEVKSEAVADIETGIDSIFVEREGLLVLQSVDFKQDQIELTFKEVKTP